MTGNAPLAGNTLRGSDREKSENLQEIVSTARSDTVTLDKEVELYSDVDVPPKITLIVEQGAKLVARTKKAHLKGNVKISSGLRQVFWGQVLLNSREIDTFIPEWWGGRAGQDQDSSRSINLALSSAAESGGGTVKLNKGRYLCTKSLMVPSNVSLIGEGIDRTIIVNPSGGIHGFNGEGWVNATVGTIGASNVTISDFTIDHQAHGTNTNGVALVPTGKHEGVIPKGRKSSHVTVERIKVLGALTHQYLIWSQGGQNIKIRDNIIDGGQVALSENVVGQDGIEIYGGYNVLVQNNEVRNMDGSGIWTFSDSTQESERSFIRVIGNHVENSRSCIDGLNYSGAHSVSYTGNTVVHCRNTGIAFNSLEGVRLNDIQIVGNSVLHSQGQGISMHGGRKSRDDNNIVIANNTIIDSAKNGINISNRSNVWIRGNTIDGSDRGIFVSSSSPGAENVIIDSNRVYNYKRDAIYVYFAKSAIVIGNMIFRSREATNKRQDISVNKGDSVLVSRNIVQDEGGQIGVVAEDNRVIGTSPQRKFSVHPTPQK